MRKRINRVEANAVIHHSSLIAGRLDSLFSLSSFSSPVIEFIIVSGVSEVGLLIAGCDREPGFLNESDDEASAAGITKIRSKKIIRKAAALLCRRIL